MTGVEAFAGTDAEWNALAAQWGGTAFHLAGWLRTVEATYGHPVLRMAARTDGAWTGLLPLVRLRVPLRGAHYVSMPYADTGGVCGATAAARGALREWARTLSREPGTRRVTLRQATPPDGVTTPAEDKVTLHLALPADADALWKAFPAKVRNQVRKAERSELTAGVSADVGAFFAVFRRVMHGLGSPTHAGALFRNLLAYCGDGASLYAVRRGGTPIGGAVALRCGATWLVPWAACLHAYFRYCPNNLLYWTMLRDAIAGGYRVFDFGRSSPGEGTYKFKRQWGAEPVPLYWQTWIAGEPSAAHRSVRGGARAAAAWRRLPAPVADGLGPRLRKYLDN